MSVNAAFIESVRELMGFVPELEIKRMFGAAGATAGGMMFAILDDDELWLKADDQTRPKFEQEGLEQFTYSTKHGERTSMAYWRAPADVWDDEEAARRWVGLAIEAALRAKAKSKAKKPKTA
jgi:DNA transformation protein